MAGGDEWYLVVDLGGTKTAVGLFAAADRQCRPRLNTRYRNSDYGGIEDILVDFLAACRVRPQTICMGIAGVVVGDIVRVTNLPWCVDRTALYRLGFSNVLLINDMTALAAALPLLGREDVVSLQPGIAAPGGVAAVLAPGTGLGEGFTVRVDGVDYPCGSEGGHCEFAPVDEEQRALYDELADGGRNAVSYEMVCAGPAIATLFAFCRRRGIEAAPETLSKLTATVDHTPVIVEAAVDGVCPASTRAIALFLAILGREGAHLALKVYARGGLFLGGGILPRLVNTISFAPFMSAFHRPGTMAELLALVPVQVIIDRDITLRGAARYAGKTIDPMLFRETAGAHDS